ncbi:MAG: gamma-glutamyl-gamma-aminobutyrate hydrolase family protein [Bdellovibrionota bacterium]
MLKVGLSSNFLHPDPERKLYKNKRILFAEEQMLHFFLKRNILPILIPTVPSVQLVPSIVSQLDGLMVTGGDDVSPHSYGEAAMKPEWSGDPFRDQYEMKLIESAMNGNIPVMGICRGIQILNVFFGGTLYQDIETQLDKAHKHRCWEKYEQWFHQVHIEKNGSLLREAFPEKDQLTVNSVHHQAIKDLGKDLLVEARSAEDKLIEAVSLNPENSSWPDRFVLGLQWHPEFFDREELHHQAARILDLFVHAIETRKKA